MGPKRAASARLAVDPALRASLVHLPASLCSALLARDVVAQTVIVELRALESVYYCGWTGLSASQSVLDDPHNRPGERVAVSTSLASLFTPPLRDGAEVGVRLFRSPPVPVASAVHVTPMHPDDWEILSIHADEVEANMLAQVRAARQGQVLAVQVGRSASTVVRFVVDKTEPRTRLGEEDSAPVAVRLSTDTEVIVAPKERAHEEGAAHVLPTEMHDAPLSPQRAAQALAQVLWRVLPSSARPVGDELAWGALVPMSHTPPSVEAPFYELVSLAFPQGRVCITKTACPALEQESEEALPQNATASTVFLPATDLFSAHAKTEALRRVEIDAQDTDDVPPSPTLRRAPADLVWPAGHVWLGDELREKLGVLDYDLVRFSAPPPGAVQAKAASAPLGVQLAAPSALAGTQAVVDACTFTVRNVHLMRMLQAAEQGRFDTFEHVAAVSKPYTSTSGILLTGSSGSGKTTIARAVGEALACDPSALFHTITIDCAQFAEERMPLVRARCKEWLDDAAWHAPTLLVLDNIDMLMPVEQENVDAARAQRLAEALVAKVHATVQDYEVFLLATAQSSTSAHAALRGGRIWTETIAIKAPGKEERKAMLHALVENAMRTEVHTEEEEKGEKSLAKSDEKTLEERLEDPSAPHAAQMPESSSFEPASAKNVSPELDWITLVGKTDGYHIADLETLTQRAVHQATIRCVLESGAEHVSLTMSDFDKAHEDFTPLSLRNVKLEASNTNWSDIGGLQATRQTLRETIEWPTKYAAIFANCPLRLRSGLLLYGYPGCGKTLLASAIAKETGLNFISVKGPELLNKYIGASEKSVRDLFERAQAAKPCVLFFDEFDSIAPKRGHDSTGVTDRVVNQMLTQMDGAEGLDGVYVLAATSRPDLIDSALLRPGRLDKSLLCDMPSLEDRLDILQAIAHKVPLDPSVDLTHWARVTQGFSGADLQALLYNASLETIHETIQASDAPVLNEARASGLQYATLAQANAPHAKALNGAERAALAERLGRIVGSAHATQKEKRTAAPKEKQLVETRHIASAFNTTRPSVPKEDIARLARVYRTFNGEREADFPDGEASTNVGARTSLM
ncbi:Peroxisome biosynthesis protein pex1 [Malassezia vespertilionis]|uniref:Peroxisomal ATPase PEX1 n=1 Tax=Malassezia vespertilionis TaxID=2020962 RepID=A0A2N1JEB2_9BASI|nr:Peroxisome biosynthesis protein pex1 [Malassezia vespertilionis]PKI84890.1 Pex1p [Malassezia vespertilionis]WFD06014.1 Peroxisome biosynthesis protein pex1 [Malassezia vespertilionis]